MFLGRSFQWLVGVNLALEKTFWYGQKLRTITPENLKVPNVVEPGLSIYWCHGKGCQVCHYIEEKCEFEDVDGNKYYIRIGVINFNTDFTVLTSIPSGKIWKCEIQKF